MMKNKISLYDKHIPEFERMKKYPKELYSLGNIALLDRPKVSIVGTRLASEPLWRTPLPLEMPPMVLR